MRTVSDAVPHRSPRRDATVQIGRIRPSGRRQRRSTRVNPGFSVRVLGFDHFSTLNCRANVLFSVSGHLVVRDIMGNHILGYMQNSDSRSP